MNEIQTAITAVDSLAEFLIRPTTPTSHENFFLFPLWVVTLYMEQKVFAPLHLCKLKLSQQPPRLFGSYDGRDLRIYREVDSVCTHPSKE